MCLIHVQAGMQARLDILAKEKRKRLHLQHIVKMLLEVQDYK